MKKAVKKLPARALGVGPSGSTDCRRDFKDFCGKWSKREAGAFRKAIRECERVEHEDWA